MPFEKPRPKIIGLSGKQYAGKDAVATLLIKTLPQYRQVPIAMAIKKAYGQQHNLSLAKIEAHKAQHRPGLIALGDWGRAQDLDYWLKAVIAQSEAGPIIISDVRLRREYELLRHHGAFLIRVEADRTVRANRGQLVSETDPTECDLDNIQDWDAVIENNGDKTQLEESLQQMIQALMN